MRDFSQSRDIRNGQQWIGWGLSPYQPRPISKRGLHLIEIVNCHWCVIDPPLRKNLVNEAECSAVCVIGDDDVVAGFEHSPQNCITSRHSGAKGTPILAPL